MLSKGYINRRTRLSSQVWLLLHFPTSFGWSSKPKRDCLTLSQLTQAHPHSNSLATKILSPALASAFFPPALFGLLNDNLEWYCLGAWKRVKKFLGSWQRARKLDKRHQHCLNQRMWGDMKRGQFFIQVKKHWQRKKDGEQWLSRDGIKHFSVCFLGRQ